MLSRHSRTRRTALPLWTLLPALVLLTLLAASSFAGPPPQFTVAFIGDQGVEPDSRAVAQLIMNEGADCVVHSGDFDYLDAPAAWEDSLNAWFGFDFPYFASIGNHDKLMFRGPGGYQEYLEARLTRLGIAWSGDLGVNSAHVYEGILFILSGAGTEGSDHDLYIRDVLGRSPTTWRVCSWHRNMRLMQVGGKDDDTGWGVYEESRRGGAIIATGHSHTYSRTHLLSSMMNQTIADSSDTLTIRLDDPATTLEDEGTGFAFVSGLGGRSIRDQELGGAWWASIYTSTQGANYGALFGVFNVDGDPRLAHFYFKSIDGLIVDEFYVRSDVDLQTTDAATTPRPDDLASVSIAPGNPASGRIQVDYVLGRATSLRLTVHDVRGRLMYTDQRGPEYGGGAHRWSWEPAATGQTVASGVYFLRLSTPTASRTVRAVLLTDAPGR